jgi:deoxyribonuclease V
LSFREGPALLAAFARLKRRPDAILIDGHGIAHPRGFGLAAHIGMWLDLPSVGCAKRRLVGTSRLPGPKVGDATPIRLDGRVVGWSLRTREKTNPIFVSPGYRADLAFSRRLALACAKGHRLPEPTRLADALAEASKPKRR